MEIIETPRRMSDEQGLMREDQIRKRSNDDSLDMSENTGEVKPRGAVIVPGINKQLFVLPLPDSHPSSDTIQQSLVTFDPNHFGCEPNSASKPGTLDQLSEEDQADVAEIIKPKSRLSRFHSMDLHDFQAENRNNKFSLEFSNLKTDTSRELCDAGSITDPERKFSSLQQFENLKSAVSHICPANLMYSSANSTGLYPRTVESNTALKDQELPMSKSSFLDLSTPKCMTDLRVSRESHHHNWLPVISESPIARRTPTWGTEVQNELQNATNPIEAKNEGSLLATVNCLIDPQDLQIIEEESSEKQSSERIILPWPSVKKPTMVTLKGLDSPIHHDTTLPRQEEQETKQRKTSNGMFIISEHSDMHSRSSNHEGLFGSPASANVRPRLKTVQLEADCSEAVDDNDHHNHVDSTNCKRLAKKSTLATCWTPSSDYPNLGTAPKLSSCTSGGSQVFQIETPTADSIFPANDGQSLFQRLCSKESAFTEVQAQKRPFKKQRLNLPSPVDPNSPHYQSCCDIESESPYPVIAAKTSKFSQFTKKVCREPAASPPLQITPQISQPELSSPELRNRRMLRTQQIKGQFEGLLRLEKLQTIDSKLDRTSVGASTSKPFFQQLKEAKTVILLGLIALCLTLCELLKH
jgi:hypothetical protein